MADVVCLVQCQPDKVTFTWSEGPDAFPTYHLTGQHPANQVAERLQLGADALRLDGVAPGQLDVADHRQGPAG